VRGGNLVGGLRVYGMMVALATAEGVWVDEAFAEVYRRSHAGTVRLAWVLCGERGVAEEVAHDAWVSALRRHRRQPLDDIESYVCRSVINAARSRARRQVLERAHLLSLRADEHGDGSQEVVDRAALAPVVHALPLRMRMCVALRFYADLSVQQTAAAMGVSEGTVKSTTSKALAHLRLLWGDDDE
jgi:RNA polymerase sigma factor (sigma-70 family)